MAQNRSTHRIHRPTAFDDSVIDAFSMSLHETQVGDVHDITVSGSDGEPVHLIRISAEPGQKEFDPDDVDDTWGGDVIRLDVAVDPAGLVRAAEIVGAEGSGPLIRACLDFFGFSDADTAPAQAYWNEDGPFEVADHVAGLLVAAGLSPRSVEVTPSPWHDFFTPR